jgi:hypothetical protein
MLRTLVLGTCVLAGVCAVAQADVYRFVDEHGGVHYSDQWVPGSELIKTTKRASSMAAGPASAATHPAAPADRASEQLAQENAQRAVKQDVAKAREQQCKEAKENYAKAIQARRMYRTTKEGEREYMSDAEVDQYRLKIRNAVQDSCGSAPSE